MKKTTLIVLLLFVGVLSFAEEKNRVIELGITTSRPLYNSYNFVAKIGDDKSVLRIGSISASDYMYWQKNDDINGNDTLFRNMTYTSNDIGFSIGREKRIDLEDNFELRYGMDITFALGQRKSEEVRDTLYVTSINDLSFSPGLCFVFGMNYVLNDKIVFGIEILPKLYFNYSYEKRCIDYIDSPQNDACDITSRYMWRFDFSSLALFSISYRF